MRPSHWIAMISLCCACGRVGYQSVPRDGSSDAPDLSPVDMSDVLDGGTDMDAAAPPSIVVTPIDGLTTTELGGTATFTLVLTESPSAAVTISLSSSDTGEGRVAPPVLAFNATNWNAPRTVTVTGVDDALADGNQTYAIVTAPSVSGDPRFNGLDADDVQVSNVDNETAGLTLSRSAGLSTSESGTSDTFTIVLNTAPTNDVAVTLSSSNEGEATVSPVELTFTSSNWASPQTVTATGVDDAVVDGDGVFTIVTSAAASAGSDYNGLEVADAEGVNSDNETPGILVAAAPELSTSEVGASAFFAVSLQAPPLDTVLVPVASSDLTEGITRVPMLAFTPTDWETPQVVFVDGQDDVAADGDQVYAITVGPSASAQAAYEGLVASSVAITNVDNESASFTASPTSGLVTAEAGGTATFTVVLNNAPTSDVLFDLSSSDTTEGTVAPLTLTFTSLNWNTPQTVTLTGVDDFSIDGDISYTVTAHVNATSDAAYVPLADRIISVLNTDDESPGITVTPASGITTSENGLATSFSVVLNSMPIATVSVGLASDNTAEGDIDVSLATFTASNWNVPVRVTVTGVDDASADGARIYHIVTAAAFSADPDYSMRNASDVTITNLDNDSVGVVASPSMLSLIEGGSSGTVEVTLTSQPTSNVVVPVQMMNTSQGSVAPASLTFTSSNWATPHVLTLAAINDAVDDGDFANVLLIQPSMSSDPLYVGVDGSDVAVTNVDNDTAGVTVTPTSGLVVTESGSTATFQVSLRSQPTSNVSLTLTSSDLTEGTVGPASLTFVPASWNTPQTVTVTGVPDGMMDGNVAFTILTGAASSADALYSGTTVDDVSVTCSDVSTPGVFVSPTSGLVTTELGGTATFSVVLTSPPSSNVTISIASSDGSEGSASPGLLTFTTANWGTPQTVTVTGANDGIPDGDIAYTIVTGNAVSADGGYSGRVVSDVSVTNADDEAAGLIFSTSALLFTWERLGTTTFTVRLSALPTADVTVPVATSDATEGTVAPASLTFTALDWNVPQTVSVMGVDDALFDGDQDYSVAFGAMTSADPGYNGTDAADFALRNMDDDGLAKGSVRGNGTLAPGFTAGNTSLSDDGRYLILMNAGGVPYAPGDTNGWADIYRTDRSTNVTDIVSLADDESLGNGQSASGAISGDGQRVVFGSDSTNLVAGDTNGVGDIFLRDYATSSTVIVTRGLAGAGANAAASLYTFSSNGRYVAYSSAATNVVAGDTNGQLDVFVFDALTLTTVRVSVTNAGAQANDDSYVSSISPDGRYVYFSSYASNLVAGDTNATADVFVRDTVLGTTTLLNVATGGAQGNNSASNAIASADGRYVAFNSQASNLVAGDTNGQWDIFLRDTMLGITTRISLGPGGVEGDSTSAFPRISADGSRVIFHSTASNLVAGDTNGFADIFFVEPAVGVVQRMSTFVDGSQGNAAPSSFSLSISADGQFAAFSWAATSPFLPSTLFPGQGWAAVVGLP